MGRYRFGPLGRLMVVDVPEGGFSDPVEEIGAVHESLNGTRTKDVLGRKATYKIDLEGLEPRALSWFEMAYHGALGAPLYFVDEQRINRLDAHISSAGSVWAEHDPIIEVAGTPDRSTVDNTALLLPGVQDGVAVSTPGPISAQEYETTTGTGLLRFGPPIPVQPGERMVFSMYVLAGTPTVEYTPYDADLVPLAQSGGTVTIAGPPERRYVVYTVPASGVAAIQPCLRHAGIQSSTWTALQLEATPGAPTPWVLGTGVARVLVESLPGTRRRIGNHVDREITLLET
jgi:hypothetical protein